MQSDKHLNNMQELSNSQNINSSSSMGGAPVPNSSGNGSGADIRDSPKMLLPALHQPTNAQPVSQQAPASSSAISSTSSTSSKPKASFRCGVCSYETSVARNLRIHWTSEKHTHNMAVLENNIKHLQALGFLQQQSQAAAGLVGGIPQLAAAQNLPGLSNMQSFLPEAALADLAYNQALMFQLLHRNSSATTPGVGASLESEATVNRGKNSPPTIGSDIVRNQFESSSRPTIGADLVRNQFENSSEHRSALMAAAAAAAAAGNGLQNANELQRCTIGSPSEHIWSSKSSGGNAVAAAAESDYGLNPDSFEPPIEPDLHPTTLYSCLICANFNTNQIDELNQHLLIDRSRTNAHTQQDIMLVISSNYVCRLCNYKTPLKANFQLHSKTDKHIQKLNYINHIKEGGAQNEYKLKYNSNNTVQLKCNCCDYYTNSIQKLNLHSQNMRHENMKIIFNHLVFSSAIAAVASSNSNKRTLANNNIGGDMSGSSDTLNNLETGSDHATASSSVAAIATEDAQNNIATSSTSSCDQSQHINENNTADATSTNNADNNNTNNQMQNNSNNNNNNNNLNMNNVSDSSGNVSGSGSGTGNNDKVILCQLCNFKANHILGMIQHVKSLRHIQIEQLICLQRLNENLESLELADVFKTVDAGEYRNDHSCFFFSFSIFTWNTTTLLIVMCAAKKEEREQNIVHNKYPIYVHIYNGMMRKDREIEK